MHFHLPYVVIFPFTFACIVHEDNAELDAILDELCHFSTAPAAPITVEAVSTASAVENVPAAPARINFSEAAPRPIIVHKLTPVQVPPLAIAPLLPAAAVLPPVNQAKVVLEEVLAPPLSFQEAEDLSCGNVQLRHDDSSGIV